MALLLSPRLGPLQTETVREVNLPKLKDFPANFPTAEIAKERFAFLPKFYTASERKA